MHTVERARVSYSAIEEFPSLQYISVAATGLGGFITGYGIGAASLLKVPIKTSPMPGVQLSTGVNPNVHGVNIQTAFGELHLPNVHTSIGADISIARADINFKDPATLSRALTLAGDPNIAVDQIKSSIHNREVHTGLAGAGTFLLAGPIALYAAKRLFSGRKIKNSIDVLEKYRESQAHEAQEAIDEISRVYKPSKRNKVRRLVVSALAGASILGGCGDTATIDTSDGFGGTPANLPGYVTNGSPFLKNASIKGHNSKAIVTGLEYVYKKVNGWGEARDQQSQNLEAQLKELKPVLEQIHDNPDNFTVLHLTGTLCNYGFLNNVLRTLSGGLDPQVTLETGDIFSDSGSTPIESECYTDLAKNSAGHLIIILGNHDNKNLNAPNNLGPSDNYNEVYDGFRFIGTTDPRAHAPNAPPPIKGSTPADTTMLEDEAFGREGALLAEEACKYDQADGKPPIVAVHYQSAGYQTELDGCASVVDSDHGRDPDPQLYPTLRAFKGPDGKYTFQNTGVSVSGYYGFNLLAPQEKLGSASFQIFSKTTHEMIGQINFLLYKDNSIRVENLALPTPENPTPQMKNFLELDTPGLFSTTSTLNNMPPVKLTP